MKKNVTAFTVAILFLSVLTTAAQNTLTGVVRNSSTGEAVPYMTIGVAGKSSGAITDTLGIFELKLSDRVTPQDSVVFQSIGYETLRKCVADFVQNQEILISPKALQLSEAVIKPRKSKRKTLGLDEERSGNFQTSFYSPYTIRQKSCEAPKPELLSI